MQSAGYIKGMGGSDPGTRNFKTNRQTNLFRGDKAFSLFILYLPLSHPLFAWLCIQTTIEQKEKRLLHVNTDFDQDSMGDFYTDPYLTEIGEKDNLFVVNTRRGCFSKSFRSWNRKLRNRSFPLLKRRTFFYAAFLFLPALLVLLTLSPPFPTTTTTPTLHTLSKHTFRQAEGWRT